MHKLMRRRVMASALGIAAATSTLAADSSIDGTYNGMTKVTFGSAPVCGPDHEASVMVNHAQITYAFGEFPLRIEVARDGWFKGRARKGNHGGGQALHIKGRIYSGHLEADIRINGVHGRVCSYHWSLIKT